MAVSLREYRARIRSTESMKKITRAMELIAASRIIKAQQRAQAAAPYARELTRAVSAVASFSNVMVHRSAVASLCELRQMTLTATPGNSSSKPSVVCVTIADNSFSIRITLSGSADLLM